LTRGSIIFAKSNCIFRKTMDCRVKPGNDEAYQWRDLDRQTGTSPAGLTRGSIIVRKNFSQSGRDCRVRPGNDGERPQSEFIHMSRIPK